MSTLVGQEGNETTLCLRNLQTTDKDQEQIALKLNQLKDKAVRYKSHEDFLSRCIAEELFPKVLKLTTIANSLTRGSQSKHFACTIYHVHGHAPKMVLLHCTSICMRSKNVSQIFKILFQTGDINIFVLCGVFFSIYVQLKSSFFEEKKINGEI